jgi:iron-sulfur cluster repair protein YtfE (RIC family)
MDSPHDPSVAAERARARLHEEIERVRTGVEEMLTEQDDDAAIREELAEIKRYVKKRLRKNEARTEKRLGKLERRIDQVEADRQHAEWRIHTNTEQMLDGLLREVRAIADLLTKTR